MAFKPNFTILAIDTSCDETSAAVTSDLRILSNVVASQVEIHKKYGGVYPTEAKRAHQQNIDPVIREALRRAEIVLRKNPTLLFERNVSKVENPVQKPSSASRLRSKNNHIWPQINALAVTVGPGLAPALEVGIQKAKDLAVQFKKPLIAVNHLEGHLLSPLAQNSRGYRGQALRAFSRPDPKSALPALALLVSGGHTQLVLISTIGCYRLLGETRDDAAGECFDKVARLLNLGYPGGPIISELTKVGDSTTYDLPIPMKDDPSLDFSFSGLKTACKYLIQGTPGLPRRNTSDRVHTAGTRHGAYLPMNRQQIQNFCASFQATIVRALLLKTELAIRLHSPQSLWLGGGVGANWQLRRDLRKLARRYRLPLFTPYSNSLFTDNAAIIGIAAFFQAQRGDFVKYINQLERLPNLNFQH